MIVGPSGTGAAFSDIQAAIDAAQPGDVVVVLAGSYGPFQLAKPLHVIGAGSALVDVQAAPNAPAIEVLGIPAGADALVSGMRVFGQLAFTPPLPVPQQVTVSGCDGPVYLQDLAWGNATGPLLIADSALVLVEACHALASNSFTIPQAAIYVEDSTAWIMNSRAIAEVLPDAPGQPALDVDNSTVYVAGCELRGGKGDKNGFGCGLWGGPAIRLFGGPGLLKVVGPDNVIVGGDGAAPWGSPPFCGPEPVGAPAIELYTGFAIVADSAQLTGGVDWDGVQQPAYFVDPAADLFLSPALYPTLAASVPTVLPGGALSLELRGTPLAVHGAYFALSFGPPTSFTGVDGATVLPLGALVPLGAVPLDGLGQAAVPITVPPIPALLGTAVVVQNIELGTPQLAFTNPVLVTVSG